MHLLKKLKLLQLLATCTVSEGVPEFGLSVPHYLFDVLELPVIPCLAYTASSIVINVFTHIIGAFHYKLQIVNILI